jgi:hypothetical protein
MQVYTIDIHVGWQPRKPTLNISRGTSQQITAKWQNTN